MLARLNWLITSFAILSCWNGAFAGEKEEIAVIKKMGGRVELKPLQPGHPDNKATLILSGCKKADEAVALLDELAPMVQEANFSDSDLSDAGIKALTKCTKLNTLNIENTRVTDAGMDDIRRFATLSELRFAGVKFTPESLRKLAKSERLAMVRFSQPTLETMAAMSQNKRISVFKIADGRVTSEMIAELQKMSLISIEFVRCQFPDGAIVALKECRSIRYLTIAETTLTRKHMAELKQCKNFGSLQLGGTGAVIENGDDFTQLTSLNLSKSVVDHEHAKQLGKLKNLEYLSLEDTNLDDRGLAELKMLNRVGSLNLDGTKITDKGLPEMKEMKQIRYFFIRRTAVTEAEAQKLKSSLQQTYIIRN